MKSNAGFSLIEVMITMAIMMVVALGAGALMLQQSREQNAAKAKATFQSLVTTVQGAANSPRAAIDSASGMVPQNFQATTGSLNQALQAQGNALQAQSANPISLQGQ